MRSIQMACLVLVLLTLFGCGSIPGTSAKNTKPAAPPLGASSSNQAGNYYYDFDDVLIPKEMDLDAGDTFILETSSEKVGVMVFDGRVERLSLTKRIIDNMAASGWTMRSAFKSTRTILIFEKPSRFCIVNITDGAYSTHMEVWVAPSTGAAPAPAPQTYAPGQPGSAVQPPSYGVAPQPSVQEQGLAQ